MKRENLDTELLRLVRTYGYKIGLYRERAGLMMEPNQEEGNLWTNLEATGSDADFVEISVEQLRELLQTAFKMGSQYVQEKILASR